MTSKYSCLCVATAERLKHVFIWIHHYFLNKIDISFDKSQNHLWLWKPFPSATALASCIPGMYLQTNALKKKRKLLVNRNCLPDKCFHTCITHPGPDTLLLRLLSSYSGKKPQSKPMLLMISVQCRGINPHIHCRNTTVAKNHLNWDIHTEMIKCASWKVTSVIYFSSYSFPEGVSALGESFYLWSFSISGQLIYSVEYMMLDL